MAKRAETTHKYRNLIDDIMEGTAIVGGMAYVIFREKVGIDLSPDVMAELAVGVAALRGVVRKILLRVLPHEEPAAAPEADSGDSAADVASDS
jgi:hypothetical protein